MRSRLNGVALLAAGMVLLVSASWAGGSKPPMKNGPTLTAKEATALIATAKSSKDHLKLALYFSQEAGQFEADAREHDEMIAAYRKVANPSSIKMPGGVGTIEHCEFLAKSDREMAKALREMAAAHEEIAQEAPKK